MHCLSVSIYLAFGACCSARITVNSQLPIGAGLGSSAAFCVCTAAGALISSEAIRSEQGKLAPDALDLINSWAFEAEKLIHGNPSGIDNCISTYGTCICPPFGSNEREMWEV